MQKFKFGILLFVLTIMLISVFVSMDIFTTQRSYLNVYQKYSSIKYKNCNLYAVYDKINDANLFLQFRKDIDNQKKVGKFYNSLYTQTKADFLSAFEQPIFVSDFPESASFAFLSDQLNPDMTKTVKSFQLNRSAFEAFDLQLSLGEIEWENIDYTNNNCPVILGKRYMDIFEIGDTIAGNFYSNSMNFEIKGFLKNDKFTDFNGDLIYAKDYIIIPYPEKLPIENANKDFLGCLYFAMINGYISLTPQENQIQVAWELFRSAAMLSGFHEVELGGLSKFIVIYDNIVSEMSNKNYLHIFFCLVFTN